MSATAHGTPLRPGDRGPVVADLQRRLARAGFETVGAVGTYDLATAEQLRAFQRSRGIDSSGVCDPATWTALVEASWRLGDRHLYLHVPMMRGDDVGALQLALGRLGFDAGRVDGIFGSDTHTALVEFQQNAGLVPDGIVGPDTVAALTRLGSRAGTEPVAVVRERFRLREATGGLAGRTVAIADLGGAGALATAIARLVREQGARVAAIEPMDPSAQAQRANRSDADAFLGLQTAPRPSAVVAHFATLGYESHGGRRLGDELARRLAEHPFPEPERAGLRVAVLRETRMPAVLVRLGPAGTVLRHGPSLARALAVGIEAWVRAPVEDEPTGSSPTCG